MESKRPCLRKSSAPLAFLPKRYFLGKCDIPGISITKVLTARDEFTVPRIFFTEGIWVWFVGGWRR